MAKVGCAQDQKSERWRLGVSFCLCDSVFPTAEREQWLKVTEGTIQFWHSRKMNPCAVVEETGGLMQS